MERFTTPIYPSIMIIDDNKIDRYVVEMIVKKTNFADNVIQIESGTLALEYLKAHADHPENLPGLVLLDVNMPEMNGFEFMEQYEKLSDAIKTTCKIMLLTSSIHPVDIDKAL